MRHAVIDLGSNTIRMSVYDEADGYFKHILSEKELIGLIGYTNKGILQEEGILRVIETVKSFGETAAAIGIDSMGCFATAGLRIIKNADEVVRRVLEKTGIKVNIISGEEESRLDFIGVWRPEGIDEGLVIDMGGASTEIVRFKDGLIENSISLPFGSLLLFKRFVEKIIPDKKEIKQIRTFVKLQLSSAEWLPNSADHICLIGGTVRAIARLHRELYGRENDDLQGYSFGARDISEMLDRVQRMGSDGVKLLTRVAPERIHTIMPGLISYTQLIKVIGCQTASISRSGVREGYLREHLNSSGV
jgi:exopolyphosphatase/guanosine-5'-triphosphate,3'-diphosphate pyrophosphatase